MDYGRMLKYIKNYQWYWQSSETSQYKSRSIAFEIYWKKSALMHFVNLDGVPHKAVPLKLTEKINVFDMPHGMNWKNL